MFILLLFYYWLLVSASKGHHQASIYKKLKMLVHMWSDNKVHELAIVCLPWQHWTKALVWFDEVDISAFHSCVAVDLWQPLSEWHLLLSVCVLVCRRENVGA